MQETITFRCHNLLDRVFAQAVQTGQESSDHTFEGLYGAETAVLASILRATRIERYPGVPPRQGRDELQEVHRLAISAVT